MTEANKRYIDITDVIRVGFNYPKNKFYVTNKDTTTYRTTIEDTLDVLQTLGIDEITEAQLEFLRDNWETLDKIYYTWDKTGSFIHSIQFNDWHDYPIIMDCHKAKMYIQNSTTIFDLDTAESAEIVRIPLIFNFFQQTLGIEISTNILLAVYNMLLSYYNPEAISSLYKKYFLTHRCTNQIAPRSEDDKDKEARYTGIFQTSNFDNNNPVEYTCTNDPLNNPIPVHIGNIGSINADTNTITLTKPLETIDPYTIEVGSKIIVVGASTIVDEETYTLDGTYTISEINPDRTIIVTEETFPTSYDYPYNTCYVLDEAPYTISSISRDNNTITVTTSPDTILVGDTVTVIGADINTTFEDITLDGKYTVSGVNRVLSSDTTSYNIQSMSSHSNTITLSTVPINVNIGDTITVYNAITTETGITTSNTTRTMSQTGTEATTVDTKTTTAEITATTSETETTTQQQTENLDISGVYTILNISQNVITVKEPIKANYTGATATASLNTYEYAITVEEPILTNFTGTGATLNKEIFISNITEATTSSITLLTKISSLPEKILNNLVGATVSIYNQKLNIREEAIVSSVSRETNVLTLNMSIHEDMEEFPELQYPTPNPDTSIEVVSSIDTEIMPTGTFIVDDFNEVVLYLSLLKDNKNKVIPTLPTEETDEYGNRSIKDSMYNTIAKTLYVPVEIKGQTDPEPQTLYLLGFGIYDEEYTAETQE